MSNAPNLNLANNIIERTHGVVLCIMDADKDETVAAVVSAQTG